MKKTLLILICLMLTGCVSSSVSQKTIIPDINSFQFPTYPIESQILNPIEATELNCNGITNNLSDIKITIKKKSEQGKISSKYVWDKMRDQQEGFVRNLAKADIKTEIENEVKRYQASLNGIYELTGKERFQSGTITDLSKSTKPAISGKTLDATKIQMSSVFRLVGKKIRTGDMVYQREVKEIPFFVFEEKIKGWGTFNGRKVIVADTFINDTFNDEKNESKTLIRAKGYSLYDPTTFILLESKQFAFVLIKDLKGKILAKMELSGSESTQLTSPQPSNEKKDWNESSEKIKELGELYNKGLITKEEFEEKKKKLLEAF